MSYHAVGLLMGTAYPPFTLSVAPTSVGGSSSSSTVTSNSSKATPVGGSGLFTYSWARTGGNSSIVAVSPSSAQTTFQATGMSISTISATFACTVKDSVTGIPLTTVNVSVSLTRGYPPLSVSGPAAIFVQTPSSSSITVSGSTSVSVSGGSGSYSYSWSSSGDFVMSAGGSSCSVSRLLGPTGGVQGSVSCTITDTGTGESTTVSASVVLINNGTPPSPPSVTVSPTYFSGGASSNQRTSVSAGVSASGSGGVPPYSYYWSNGKTGSSVTYVAQVDPYQTVYGSGSVQCVDSQGQSGFASFSGEWTNYGFV